MAKLLDNLSLSPATSLPTIFAKEIREYLHGSDFRDIVSFIRNLRDKIIGIGGYSDYVLSVIDLILQDEPQETPEQSLFRRQLAGLAGLDDDAPLDPDMEITRVDVPRSNPSWPIPASPEPVPSPGNRRSV